MHILMPRAPNSMMQICDADMLPLGSGEKALKKKKKKIKKEEKGNRKRKKKRPPYSSREKEKELTAACSGVQLFPLLR